MNHHLHTSFQHQQREKEKDLFVAECEGQNGALRTKVGGIIDHRGHLGFRAALNRAASTTGGQSKSEQISVLTVPSGSAAMGNLEHNSQRYRFNTHNNNESDRITQQ